MSIALEEIDADKIKGEPIPQAPDPDTADPEAEGDAVIDLESGVEGDTPA